MDEAQRDLPCDAAVHAMLSTLIECGYSSNQINAAFAKLGYRRHATEEAADQVRDAARYRWLRQWDVDSYLACGRYEELDAAVDAALAASGDQHTKGGETP